MLRHYYGFEAFSEELILALDLFFSSNFDTWSKLNAQTTIKFFKRKRNYKAP